MGPPLEHKWASPSVDLGWGIRDEPGRGTTLAQDHGWGTAGQPIRRTSHAEDSGREAPRNEQPASAAMGLRHQKQANTKMASQLTPYLGSRAALFQARLFAS